MDNPFINPAIISYCPGFHGLDRGVKRAIGPTRTVAYLEIEAFLVQNILWGIEAGVLDAAPIWPNLKTFDAKPFRGKVHGIIGGYPCQGESTAGKRKLWNDPRFLYPFIERDFRVLEPIWGFFENVGGHLTGSFPYVLESLQRMGYAVEAGIFTAEEVGAPHKRERLFIHAIRRDFLANSIRINGGLPEPIQRNESIKVTGCSKGELAHPGMQGLQGKACREFRVFHQTTGTFQRCESGRIYTEKWPARPGQPQYEWERPRTTEPGLGCTVNGYNFREDLLRAYGNSVVEQTAELAFRTLYKKHFDK